MAAPTVGQTAFGSALGSSSNTTSSVTTAASGSRFLIILGTSAAPSSVSDSKSNTYTLKTSLQFDQQSAGQSMRVYECINGIGGAGHTATATYGTSANRSIILVEIQNCGGTDRVVSLVDTASPYTITSGGLASSKELAILVGAVDGVANPVGFSESTGFTIQQAQQDNSSYNAYFVASKDLTGSTASITPSFTGSGSAAGASILLTFTPTSFVQKGSVNSVAGGVSATPSITSVTAGNALICVLSTYSSSSPTLSAPTDSSGQTWTLLGQSAWNNPKRAAIFYLLNANAGTHNLTFGSQTGSQISQIAEYNGVYAVGGTAVAAGSSSFTTSQSSGNYTPSQANEVVIAVCSIDSTTNPETLTDPPTGWLSLGAQRNGATYSPAEFAYQETASTSPVSATWSWTTAGASAIVVAGLKFSLAPVITSQPVQQSALAGSTATFSVTATASAGSLSYLWYKNGSSTGGTASSYTTPTLSNADNGATYYCAVSDSNGAVNTAIVYGFIIGESAGDGDKMNSAWFFR